MDVRVVTQYLVALSWILPGHPGHAAVVLVGCGGPACVAVHVVRGCLVACIGDHAPVDEDCLMEHRLVCEAGRFPFLEAVQQAVRRFLVDMD